MEDERPIVVMLGPPGAGKGTQAELLADKLGLKHIATGDLLREELSKGTALGQLAKSYMERGELVPDEVVARMVAGCLSGNRGAVLDGFPRNLNQAEILERLLAENGQKVTVAIQFEIGEEVLVRRLSARYLCSNCQTPYNLVTSPPRVPGVCDKCGAPLYQRADDQPETVKKRLQVYREQTEPVVAFYRSRGLLRKVDADQTIEAVSAALMAIMADPV